MSATEVQAFPTGEPNPLTPAEGLLHQLGGTSAHLAAGVALGLLAARAMRVKHSHWSWAALAALVLLGARQSLGGLSSTLVTAGLCAAVRGRRWHREDIAAGGDLAELARRRATPWSVLRPLATGTRLGLARRFDRRSARGRCEMTLGYEDHGGRPVAVPLGSAGAGVHTLVLGATGSGKTVTQTAIAACAIARGMGAIVLDPKGDGEMREQLRRAAQAAGRAFVEWTPHGRCVYNPYASGGDSEIADKVLAGERFTEPHYLRQAQRYLGHVVRALRAAGREISLAAIVEQLDPARLEDLLRGLDECAAEQAFAYLDSLTPRQQADLAGVRDRLAILVESDVGLWLDPRTSSTQRLALHEAVVARATVYISLEADLRPLIAQMLGAAIVQDLQTTVARLQGRPVPTLVVIDEFSAVAAEQVVRLFGRARSGGFSLLLGTQELSDLRLSGYERLLEQVLGNLSVLIAHRQVVPASADLIASVAGTRGAWKLTRHSTGSSTRTRTRERVLDPSTVMSLGRGCAAVFVLGDGASVRIARVLPPGAGR